jgi:hypothetical protein
MPQLPLPEDTFIEDKISELSPLWDRQAAIIVPVLLNMSLTITQAQQDELETLIGQALNILEPLNKRQLTAVLMGEAMWSRATAYKEQS